MPVIDVPSASKPAAGYSLIEVLVAVLVLSLGILGVAALQLAGLGYTQGAYQSSQATAVASDLIDRMRTNPGAVSGGAFDDLELDVESAPALPDPGCSTDPSGCSPTQLARFDIRDWALNSLSRLGGGARAKVEGDGDAFTLTLRWDDAAERDDEGALVPRTMVTEVRLQ